MKMFNKKYLEHIKIEVGKLEKKFDRFFYKIESENFIPK